MINNTTLELLINPYNNEPLNLENDSLVDASGNSIPIIDGIPDFLVLEETSGLNKKYREFYDKISKLSDAAEFVYSLFMNLEKFRADWMRDVEVKEGYNVLETSVGTGFNIKILPKNATYFGFDISRGMLKQCQKNRKRWNREIELFQGNAEYLPFKNETFDSVFHVGGINFFNDRKRAIDEMIRVAKPTTKIVIIDETEKRVARQYGKTPFVKKYFNPADMEADRMVAPVDLVPAEMKEIEVKLLDKNKMYQLSFRKP
jgi:ubiquinone/menaquinone biosynthesis C-methylase UbiE